MWRFDALQSQFGRSRRCIHVELWHRPPTRSPEALCLFSFHLLPCVRAQFHVPTLPLPWIGILIQAIAYDGNNANAIAKISAYYLLLRSGRVTPRRVVLSGTPTSTRKYASLTFWRALGSWISIRLVCTFFVFCFL